MCLAEMMRAREQVLTMQVDSALRKAKELEDENTKLREQINKLKKLVWQYNSALNCLLKTGICTRQCVACWTFMDPAWLEDRMRELGIEVDYDKD